MSYLPTLAEYILMCSPFLFVPLLPHPETTKMSTLKMVPSTLMTCTRLVLPPVDIPVKMESFPLEFK